MCAAAEGIGEYAAEESEAWLAGKMCGDGVSMSAEGADGEVAARRCAAVRDGTR